jgi:hypothetical protein
MKLYSDDEKLFAMNYNFSIFHFASPQYKQIFPASQGCFPIKFFRAISLRFSFAPTFSPRGRMNFHLNKKFILIESGAGKEKKNWNCFLGKAEASI